MTFGRTIQTTALAFMNMFPVSLWILEAHESLQSGCPIFMGSRKEYKWRPTYHMTKHLNTNQGNTLVHRWCWIFLPGWTYFYDNLEARFQLQATGWLPRTGLPSLPHAFKELEQGFLCKRLIEKFGAGSIHQLKAIWSGKVWIQGKCGAWATKEQGGVGWTHPLASFFHPVEGQSKNPNV
jgi:hypothetical protein